MDLFLKQHGLYEGQVAAGLRLAETAEAEGGWAEYFSESELGDLRMDDPILKAQTALLLENTKRWMAGKAGRLKPGANGLVRLDEATRSALVGGFSDYLFPIIRASFPTNAINDLVSVQATTRRTASVVYWNWVVGGDQAKGLYVPGQRLFDANRGKQDAGRNFSSEYIDGESVGTGDGTANPALTALRYRDGGGIRPGTVRITGTIAGPTAVTITDNGNGGWTNGIVGTIDYKTGAMAITFSGLTVAASAITAFYRYDSEGSSLIPQMDVQITTSTVETERRALKFNYSTEAMHDVMAEFGVDIEPNLVASGAEQINGEIARQLIGEMWAVAASAGTFAKTGPVGYSQRDHYNDLMNRLTEASNGIWARTQKAHGNWIVVDEGAANVIEAMEKFVAAPAPASLQGVHFIGTLGNKYRVYKDLHLNKEPGAAAVGNILMGFKGRDFWEAGLVYAPYRLLYTTETLTTADHMAQKGMASRYAVKMVNNLMYAKLSITV